MIEIFIPLNSANIEVFKILANKNRISILEAISIQPMNISQLATQIGVSNAIISRHIALMEKHGLIRTEIKQGSTGSEKYCYLTIDEILIKFPEKIYHQYSLYELNIPVGYYTKHSVKPTCGLASEHRIINQLDNPESFKHIEKRSAQIVWFSEGYIEYEINNPLEAHQQLKLIEISFEGSSEFPENNYVWPSDIDFLWNGVDIGRWTASGNYADTRGALNPTWWPDNYSQYGVLKTIRISENETHLDGIKLSNYKVSNVNTSAEIFTLRFSVNKKKYDRGGFTLFGKNYGNYAQNIMVKIYYV